MSSTKASTESSVYCKDDKRSTLYYFHSDQGYQTQHWRAFPSLSMAIHTSFWFSMPRFSRITDVKHILYSSFESLQPLIVYTCAYLTSQPGKPPSFPSSPHLGSRICAFIFIQDGRIFIDEIDDIFVASTEVVRAKPRKLRSWCAIFLLSRAPITHNTTCQHYPSSLVVRLESITALLADRRQPGRKCLGLKIQQLFLRFHAI